MSTPPSSRYQSRLFNFLSQRTRRWADSCDRALRHLQVAVTWGVQIALYPAYVIFQSTRLAGKQLQQAVKQGLPKLRGSAPTHPDDDATPSPVNPDTPVQQVLQATQQVVVQSLDALLLISSSSVIAYFQDVPEPQELTPVSSGFTTLATSRLATATLEKPQQEIQVERNTSSSATSLPALQGIASLVATRRLVLVTSENQILDILTPEQQKQIQQRMIWELASYYHRVRSLQIAQQPFTARIRPPAAHTPVLPFVRGIWQLMAWVQTSSVAIAINLFQEATLAESSTDERIGPHLPDMPLTQRQAIARHGQIAQRSILAQLTPYKALSLLDRNVAGLETRQLPSLLIAAPTTLVHHSREWIGQLHPESAFLTPAPPHLPATVVNLLQDQSQRLQALIQAAFNYFFNKSQTQLSAGKDWGGDLPSSPLRSLPFKRAATGELSLPSLPPFPPIQSNPLFTYFAKLLSVNPFSGDKNRSTEEEEDLWLTMHDLFGEPESLSSLDPDPDPWEPSTPYTLKGSNQPIAALGSHHRPAPTAPLSVSTTGAIHSVPPSNHHPEHSPSWIETEAKAVGYVKHPLEQLLAWVDQGMRWLEDSLIALGQWIQQHWRW
ncbi:MAG: hypothetical protein VKJ46_00985 [Leptolyngbyaceae bacterium]|nr:hypothetical protein [Leptolyngbyaceae bacterium]